MSDEEREVIRQVGAQDAGRSRAERGFPERIEDLAAVTMLAATLRDIPASGYRAKAPAMKGPGGMGQKIDGDGHHDPSPPLFAPGR